MKNRQARRTRVYSASNDKQKSQKQGRYRELNDIREKKQEHKSELGMFDFLFSFGVLC